MKQKILFFDIDGTLIDEETDVVPESAKKALAAAKEKGHLLFICSGAVEPILRWKAKKCIIIHCRWNCKKRS